MKNEICKLPFAYLEIDMYGDVRTCCDRILKNCHRQYIQATV